MKIELQRTTYTENSTIGRMFVDGVFQCYTLEDMVRPDGVKVYGETAIPPGVYDVTLTMSPRFRRVLPLLLDVKNFVGVRIHPGNSARDTEGCILVGETAATDWIGRSKVAFDKLLQRMQAELVLGKKIELTIS
jgi:hypothetical protein